MARIYYFSSGGKVYGVHPGPFGDNVVPAGVDFIDVPEAPDQIAWPVTVLGRSGEKFTKVISNTLTAFEPAELNPIASGAQMVDEAESRGKLDMLTLTLTASEMAVFVTRRRIVAGSNFAEVLRAKLGVTVPQMAGFIAAASVRNEV